MRSKMKVFLVTDNGVIVPCTIKKNVIRPTVKGGYKILRLANENKTKVNEK
jgi:hypothetical protein